MSDALLGWLTKRRESQALKSMRDHLALTLSCANELSTAINSACKGNHVEAEGSIKRVSQMETEADFLRRKIADELAKGELPSSDREDLMRLVRTLDWVADWSKDAARILAILLPEFSKIPKEIQEISMEMSTAIRSCVSVLADTLNRLGKSSKEVLDLGDKVERIEEQVDEQYEEARRLLANVDDRSLKIGAVILLSEFLDSLENVADWCENTADEVRVIAVRQSSEIP
jgi:predicted phosphate transport protein (TIGR00153 family)